MGDETRQIIGKLEDVIRGTATQVNNIAVTQAVICTKQDAMHKDVKKLNGRVTTVEDKTDDLESWQDQSEAAKKNTRIWVAGIVGFLGLLFTAFKIWG